MQLDEKITRNTEMLQLSLFNSMLIPSKKSTNFENLNDFRLLVFSINFNFDDFDSMKEIHTR